LSKLDGSADNATGELIVSKGRIPEAGLAYIRKLRDVKYSETIFEILLKQFELAKLDEAKQGSLVQVVDPAVSPDKRSFPKRTLLVLLATALGFLAGVLIAFVISGFERMQDDSETARRLNLLRRALSLKG
jgi:uncharacterized protein involved in exopolysaccharide biosynthesis